MIKEKDDHQRQQFSLKRTKKKGRSRASAEDLVGFARTKVLDPTHLFYKTRDTSLLFRLTPKAVRLLGARPEDVYNRETSR
jgi:hypothetical protein